MSDVKERAAERVAVIGMSGRFPRAADVEQLWANVRDGVDCVSSFSDEELLREGVDPALLQEPAYVRRKAVLENVDGFDAALFQLSAREAEITDPQQRLFLECAWEALESAGYDPDRFDGWIGVYAGADSLESYFLNNLYPNARLRELVGDYQLFLSNDKEFLPTRVSYKLNLKGPSVNVQTGCSTSLVSVSMACESLLGGQCDMALAGGVAVSFPVKKGYLYQKGMILSPDGRCRAFDAEASGTVDGSGVGVLLLKRLDRALDDGDRILAVLSGWAVNNDGSAKVGFTAPSIEGQAEVIATAMAAAGADPSSIGYIEAHGTGTRVGDPIEMSALKLVFEPRGLRKGSCAIGSIKTNIGHLGAAAGIAGLIKAIQAVRYGALPPSLHFEAPNPLLGLEDSPFYVNTSLKPWKVEGGPRRAGVSSFGIGGTNAHVIVEEPPAEDDAAAAARPGRAFEVLALSAKTPSALDAMTTRLVEHLAAHPELDLADVSYTLQTGRRVFAHRRALVVPRGHGKDGSAALDPAGFRTGEAAPAERPVVFMLPGQGAQHVGMARDLYESEPVVRHAIDACAEVLAPKLGLDLRRLLHPRDGEAEEAARRLRNTAMAQPALFAVEYALARLWTSWGITPRYLIGHSLGEYVAACLAEVLSLEDALEVVAARGRLMASLPPGAMLAVPLPEQEARALLGDRLSLAVINGPSLCVLSGDLGAVETLERELSGRGLEYTRLQTSHAFHSKMMDPILGPFAEVMRRVTLRPPTTRYISNVTGTWISDAEATDPSYWVRHLRETVRFSDGLARLLDEPEPIFLEVGPGRALTGALKLQHANVKTAAPLAIATLGAPRDPQPDTAHLMSALAQLWIAGTPVDWAALHTGAPRKRVPLPTYPFERRRYFIDPPVVGRGRGLARAEERAAPTPWGALVDACRAQAARGHGEVENAEARARQEALDRLCVGYIGLSLTRLGAFADPARECSEEEVLEGARVLPQYHQLVRGWLRILADAGHLTRAGEAGDRFLPAGLPTEASVARLAREAAALWAETPHVFQGVRSSGEGIADVLSGRRSPQELSFDGGSFDAEQKVIEEMALVRYCNAILCEGIRAVLASVPADAGLRILEVGAGMGITSSWVLPLLPASRTSYTFTDVGRLFLAKAQERFAAFPFMRYGLLNLERPPSEQGYERHGHDVVIASNVLHVTRSTAETLRGVHELLAPGGLLLMWEITEHQLEFEVTSGFLMNPVEDGTRSQGNPFLTKEQWFALLRECGFVEMAAFPERPVLGHQILVAQRARSAEPSASLAFTSPAGPPREAAAQAAHPRPALRSAYLAPRDEVERRIAAIWQDLLGVDRVGVHDDYFELGGDSLLSVRLVGALRESLGVEIPARRLLDARTVAALAALAQERSPAAAPHPSLVTLEAGGSGRPLFLVHPVGGNVLCYAQLARRLGSDRPIHGLQAAGLDGKEPPLARIEEIASRHIEAMRRVDPSGPYLLGGWSYGGIVAHEMAAQLERQGASVSLLALLDSGAPNHSFTMPALDDAALLAWFARDLGACEDGELDGLLAALRRLDPADQIRHVLDRTQSAGDLRPLVEVFKTHLRALHRYESPACSAPILLLRCPEIFHWFRTGALGSSEAADLHDPADPALGWRKVGSGAVEVCTIPGDHYSLLTDPHVGAVAEILKSRLARIG